MKHRRRKADVPTSSRERGDSSGSEHDVGDMFTDEISEFTDARNKIDLEDDRDSESEEEEELFGLADEEDESDEELGEWSKRLKQIKFQTKLEKKKALPGDAPEKSWGSKRTAFYGSGVKRKPKEAVSDEEDEWTMEQKEIEKLQQKLDEDVDEEDFLIPSLAKKPKEIQKEELTIKRDLSEKEKEELKKTVHPEAEPLREELNKCLEELEKLKAMKGWKVESRDTCFRLLAANIAFYLHLIDSNADCRGHPVLKRIVQWKKLAKMYETIPWEQMETSDASDNDRNEELDNDESSKRHKKKRKLTDNTETETERRTALEDSEDETEEEEDLDDNTENIAEGEEELENRPITYEIEKNKPKKKTAPNNPRVKHREKFRKAKIRRRGKIREYRPEINKYQGEASGIRAGVVRSVRLK